MGACPGLFSSVAADRPEAVNRRSAKSETLGCCPQLRCDAPGQMIESLFAQSSRRRPPPLSYSPAGKPGTMPCPVSCAGSAVASSVRPLHDGSGATPFAGLGEARATCHPRSYRYLAPDASCLPALISCSVREPASARGLWRTPQPPVISAEMPTPRDLLVLRARQHGRPFSEASQQKRIGHIGSDIRCEITLPAALCPAASGATPPYLRGVRRPQPSAVLEASVVRALCYLFTHCSSRLTEQTAQGRGQTSGRDCPPPPPGIFCLRRNNVTQNGTRFRTSFPTRPRPSRRDGAWPSNFPKSISISARSLPLGSDDPEQPPHTAFSHSYGTRCVFEARRRFIDFGRFCSRHGADTGD